MNFKEVLEKHIVKLVGELKDEDGLKEVMKRKLTKKEFKVFCSLENGISIDEVAQDIKADATRVEELYKGVIKKVNQELFKRELIDQ